MVEPSRTSPTANTRGMLVSRIIGGRSSGHAGESDPTTQQVRAREHEPPAVPLDLGRQPISVGISADQDEQSAGLMSLDPPGAEVAKLQSREPSVAIGDRPDDLCPVAHLDVLSRLELVPQVSGHAVGQGVTTDQERHPTPVAREVHCGLTGRVPAADDEQGLAGQRLPLGTAE